MSDQEPVTGHSARLLRGLIWAGVLLAPLAAAVVLIGGSSGSVRFAVVLIAVSVVLIGASMLIRNDPVLQRMDVEDRVAEEIATLRRELRAEFGRGGAAPVRAATGPVRAAPGPVRGGVAPVRSGPPPEESSFFADAPMPDDDPFAAPMPAGEVYAAGGDPYAGDPYDDDPYAAPMVADEPYAAPMGPVRPEPAFGTGGRASVPVAAAAAVVRPVPVPGPGVHGPGLPPRGPQPGMATTGRPTGPGLGRREPGMGTGGREPGLNSGARPPAPGLSSGAVSPADGAPVPRQRGAAPVRPGAVQYGRSDGLDADFGASTGYAGVNPAPGHTYGAPVDDGYGPVEDGYAYPETGYDDADGYPDDYDTGQSSAAHQAADPNYRARRHRPSANDTNIGTLADFAAMDGYGDPPADDRYVTDYPDEPYGRRR